MGEKCCVRCMQPFNLQQWSTMAADLMVGLFTTTNIYWDSPAYLSSSRILLKHITSPTTIDVTSTF
jgi:hypothetical protein